MLPTILCVLARVADPLPAPQTAAPRPPVCFSFPGGPRSIGVLGDVDSDGRPDLVFGHARGDVHGVVYVVSGDNARLLSTACAPEGCHAFGSSVAAWFDFDGDGTRDYAVGAPGTSDVDDPDRGERGAVCICSGRTAAILARFDGREAGDRFGHEVIAGYDFDRDGKRELLVGAPGIGKAFLLSGKDGSEMLAFGEGDRASLYGTSIAIVGDFDHDGCPDAAIGAPLAHASGTVDVVSGRDGHLLVRLEAGDLASADDERGHPEYRTRFGCAISPAGDLDGDGKPDLLVGADYAGTEGSARVISLATGKVLREFRGSEGIFSRFGSSLIVLGDVDGDGSPEYVISDPDDDLDGPGSPGRRGQAPGSVSVFSGKTGLELFRVFGDKHLDRLGYSVAACSDVNGDGVSDFAAEAHVKWGGAPYFRVYSGKDGSVLLQFDPPSADRTAAR